MNGFWPHLPYANASPTAHQHTVAMHASTAFFSLQQGDELVMSEGT